MNRRFLFAPLACFFTSAAPAANPAALPPTFLAAHAAEDLPTMGKIYDAALVERLDKGKATGPDPMLDAMVGLMAASTPTLAVPRLYLARAAAAGGPDAGFLLLQLAASEEMSGAPDAAQESYRKAVAAATDPTTRRSATYAVARFTMARAPDAAAAMLTAALEGVTEPADRWEGDLLLSRAYAMTGRKSDAQSTLARAWSEAPFAKRPDRAIARTASDMQFDAIGRPAQIALHKASRSDDDVAPTYNPPCTAALTPDDNVLVEIAHDASNRTIVSVVRSSRAGIADPFVSSVQLSRPTIKSDVATVMLRCSRAPATSFPVGPASNPLMAWLAGQALYPPIVTNLTEPGDTLAELQGWLAAREAKLGRASPALIPALLEIAMVQAMQGMQTQNAGYGQFARETLDRALVLTRAAGAPADALRAIETQRDAMAPSAGYAARKALLTQAVADVLEAPATSVDQANEVLQSGLGSPDPAAKTMVTDRVLGFYRARRLIPTDPRFQAAIAAKIDQLREGGLTAQIAPLVREGRLPPRACAAQPTEPNGKDLFTADDYPTDLTREDVAGVVIVETDVAADGSPIHPRIILATPPGLFDAATLGKYRTGHLTPATDLSGKAVACSGAIIRMRWRLPDDGETPVEALPAS